MPSKVEPALEVFFLDDFMLRWPRSCPVTLKLVTLH